MGAPANKDAVHISHCCVIHGCKYGYGDDSGCVVVKGEVVQDYLCESCSMALEEVDEIIKEAKLVMALKDKIENNKS